MNEATLFRAYGIRWYHCNHIEQVGAFREPCDERASAVWFTDEGVSKGWCPRHAQEGRQKALVRHWTQSQPEEAAA